MKYVRPPSPKKSEQNQHYNSSWKSIVFSSKKEVLMFGLTYLLTWDFFKTFQIGKGSSNLELKKTTVNGSGDIFIQFFGGTTIRVRTFINKISRLYEVTTCWQKLSWILSNKKKSSTWRWQIKPKRCAYCLWTFKDSCFILVFGSYTSTSLPSIKQSDCFFIFEETYFIMRLCFDRLQKPRIVEMLISWRNYWTLFKTVSM